MKKIMILLWTFLVWGVYNSWAQCISPCVTSASVITSDITSNTTWTAGNTYLVKGVIHVTSGNALTIQNNVVVLFEKSSFAGLVVDKNAKLIVSGTDTNPVVFTSDQESSCKAPGDFAGVIINGQATNCFLNNNMDMGSGNFLIDAGGSIDNDNSGSIEYLRIEYSRYGLKLASVGNQTLLKNIQVSYADSNSFEFLGGTVRGEQLVSFNPRNADFVFSAGNRSLIRESVGLRTDDTHFANDINSFSSGIIMSFAEGTGYSGAPVTHPVLDRMTIIGPYTCHSSLDEMFKYGVFLTDSTEGEIYHSIITGWDVGYYFNGDDIVYNATTGGTIHFAANTLYGNFSEDFASRTGWISPSCVSDMYRWVHGEVGCSQPFNQIDDPLLDFEDMLCKNYCTAGAPDFVLGDVSSLETTHYVNIDNGLSNPFFISSDYRGAFDQTTDWTLGWTEFCPINYNPCPELRELSISEHTFSSGSTADPLTLYPNPVQHNLCNLRFTSGEKNQGKVQLFEITGKMLWELNINIEIGTQEISLSTQSLAQGSYLIKVISGSNTYQGMLFIQ